MNRNRVLIVDDDTYIRRLLSVTLARADYEGVEARTGAEALDIAGHAPVDAILLDLGLPDRDGLELVPLLRKASRAPIIVLSARQDTADKVAALDLGASDYVTKPFDTEELLARLRSSLRQAPAGTALAEISVGDIAIDPGARSVRRAGAELHLTRREFDVLIELARAPGRVVTHKHILETVWRVEEERRTEYLRIIIRQLRQKLEQDPARPRLILNELGIGYKLALPASDRR